MKGVLSSAGKKRNSLEASLEADDDVAPRKKFISLKPRIRHIPQDVVTSKWEVLTGPVQDQVRELFKAVQRPVVMMHQDENRRSEAQTALKFVSRSLEKKLPRWPFPPNVKDSHFNYEELLNGSRILESMLTPATHAVALLKAEIKKEEQALEADRERLAGLEANAKAEDASRKRQAKKVHSLLRSSEPINSVARDQDNAVDFALVTAASSQQTLSLVTDLDPDLQPLIAQLQSHLDSMQSNMAQVKDVGLSVTKTKVAVDDLMYKCLDSEQYLQLQLV
ncbi:MAG: hypothetical protein M1827_005024 [Pycnora praestabilis]|nr:MAG: hypothetical protein M1827_005024 [Pycnora praestabilis]